MFQALHCLSRVYTEASRTDVRSTQAALLALGVLADHGLVSGWEWRVVGYRRCQREVWGEVVNEELLN